jgi:hypothetical protein
MAAYSVPDTIGIQSWTAAFLLALPLFGMEYLVVRVSEILMKEPNTEKVES